MLSEADAVTAALTIIFVFLALYAIARVIFIFEDWSWD